MNSGKEVKKLIDKYNITLISCGNGTASRESEKIIADMIKEYDLKNVDYVITNEAGASQSICKQTCETKNFLILMWHKEVQCQ